MADFLAQAERLREHYQRKIPPVDQWNPPLSGDLDMRIAHNGTWFYLGGEIKRRALADLFSSILKKEGESYFLVTPVEKWKIVVEDAPFIVTEFAHVPGQGVEQEHVVFFTANGDRVVLGRDHPLWMEKKSGQLEAQPYLMIRAGMPGLIHRNVYYQLVDLALEQGDSAGDASEGRVGVRSCGEFFSLV